MFCVVQGVTVFPMPFYCFFFRQLIFQYLIICDSVFFQNKKRNRKTNSRLKTFTRGVIFVSGRDGGPLCIIYRNNNICVYVILDSSGARQWKILVAGTRCDAAHGVTSVEAAVAARTREYSGVVSAVAVNSICFCSVFVFWSH